MQGTALPLVANRYELVERIGSGGMGVVWLARDSSLDRPCAVKLLDAAHLDDDEVVSRFQREARTTACIRSPHVIEVFDHGTWCGIPFIVMEFLQGEDLGTRLQRVGRIDLPTTCEIVRQLASGLSSAHAAGIVHRDLKPANVLIVPVEGRDTVKLIDFGIANNARLPSSTLVKGVLLGTPEYMSPEQARGLPVDARTDVFALGVLTYECLSGQTPSDREQGPDDALHDGVPRLAGAIPGIPPAFDLWIARALARDRERRFQSVKELADSLEQLIEGPARFAPVHVGLALARQNDARVTPPTCTGAAAAILASCTNTSRARSTGMRARRVGKRLPWFGIALVLPAALGVLALGLSGEASGAAESPTASLDLYSAVPGEATETHEAPSFEPEPIVTPLHAFEPCSEDGRARLREGVSRRGDGFAKGRSGPLEPSNEDSSDPRSQASADISLSDRLAGLRRNVVVTYGRARFELAIPMLADSRARPAYGPGGSGEGAEF